MKRQIIFYLINIIIFPILVWVIIPFAQNLFHYNTGSDAAGAAMSSGFRYLYLCAFWCIIMLIVSAIASHFLFHKFWAGIICSAVGISLLWALPEGLDLYKFHHIKYIEHAFYYQIDGEYHKEVYESGRYKNEGRMPVGEIIFYDNGIKTHSATYKKGLMNGLYCKYYDNGVMSERGLKISKAVLSGNESDKHDEYCQGEWTFYHRNGDLDDTRIFDHGKILSSDNYNYIYHKEGTKTERFIIDIKTGKKVTTDLVLEGIIDDYTIPFHYTCSIVNGKMHGAWKGYYDSRGEVPAGQGYSINGKPDGEQLNYYSTGELWIIKHYSEGVLEGEYIEYYTNGNKMYSSNYKNNKRDGIARWWYENGTIETESEYLDGELNGIYREYDEQGNLIEEQLYKYGAPINES